MGIQRRGSDFIQNPDYSFIKGCVMDLKKTGICYAYKKWQVKEIEKMLKNRYDKEITYKLTGWYYVIRICH